MSETISMQPPDPAAVDAAIAQIKGKSRPCEDDWELLENAELLADACEHYRQQLAAVTARAERMREALVGAKSFIENLKVPQTVSEAAEQVRQGMHRMNCIEAALNQEGNDDG